MAEPRRIWVCGTGTEIGKTHVACALCADLVRRGAGIVARKPVESGYDESDPSATDAHRLAAACATAFVPPVYRFEQPVSPHLAARRQGRPIRLPEIDRWLDRDEDASLQLVETAGGLLSPLGPQLTNLDMVSQLRADAVVLVAPDRLGVLHDVTVSLMALESRGLLSHAIVVLSAPDVADASTGSNAAELLTLSITDRVIAFERAQLGAVTTQQAAASLATALANSFT